MSYVQRDEEQNIVGVYAKYQKGIAEEFLEDAQLHKFEPSSRQKRELDYEEDLDGIWDVIDALILAVIDKDDIRLKSIKKKINAIKVRHP